MPKTPKRKSLHVITKYFFEKNSETEAHIVKTYNAFDPAEWNVTVHASTDTLEEKNILLKREVIGEMLVRRSVSGLFGFNPKINWEKADMVCLYGFKLFPHLPVLATVLWYKLIGSKKFVFVMIPQGAIEPYWKKYRLMFQIGKKLYHYMFGRALINLTADAVLTSSAWERSAIKSCGIRKDIITVLPEGVEQEAYEDLEKLASAQIREQVSSYGTYILQIGRIAPVKNYETAMRALTYLPDHVKLVIAGSTANKSYLEKLNILAHEYNIENQVVFHGTVRSYDKYYLIKHAKALLHIPFWDSAGTVLYEAMSQGTICVSGKSGAPGAIIKDETTGLVCQETDDLQIGKRLNQIIKHSDSQMESQIVTRGLKIAKDHRDDLMQRKLEILYSTVIMKHRYPYRLPFGRSV